MAAYPGAIYAVPSFGTNMSDVKTHSTWRDEMVDELRAVELELGTTPSGTFSTVKDRIAAVETNEQCLEFAPAGNTDALAATMTDWVTLGNLTVPTWATSVIVQMNVVGWYAISAVTTHVVLRVSVGATNGSTNGRADGYVLNERLNTSWADQIAGIGTGTQALKVQQTRTAGTGAIRVDTSSRFNAIVRYL